MHGHNLYRQHFTPAERRALDLVPKNDLTGEVNLLRIMLRRFLAGQAGAPPAGLKLHLDSLRVTSGGAAMVASLLRTHARARGPATALERVIEEVLATVNPYLDLDRGGPDAS